MIYRAEVDGLRALAIAPVVLFHAGISGFSGGFIGVDIFFVISGYLITAKIITDLQTNRFNLWDFYERRARRILPVLVIVLVSSIALFYVILVPSDYTRFAHSVTASLKLTSESFFRKSGGYFDDLNYPRPLLHTWSLSIEEKYYLAFPVIFLAAYRWRQKQALYLTIVATVLMFVVSLFFTTSRPEGAYYMFFARIWEILAGASVAVLTSEADYRVSSERWIRETLSWASITVIALAFHYFRDGIAYPGLYALAPVLGTCLLIMASRGTLLGSILATRPLVFIGLLSYSIYMWHQPVIVAAVELDMFSGWWKLAVLAAILLLALASWHLVEKPFRQRSRIGSRIFVCAGAFAVASIIGITNYSSTLGQLRMAALMPSTTEASQLVNKCFLLDTSVSAFDQAECVLSSDKRPKVMIIGDSHAASIYPALKMLADDKNIELRMMSAAYCLPLVTDFPANTSETGTPRCSGINKQIEADLQARKPDLILLSAYMYSWSAGANINQVDPRWTYEGYYPQFLRSLAELSKIGPTVVIGQLPIWQKSLPDLIALETGRQEGSLTTLPVYDDKGLARGLFQFDETYKRDVRETGAKYISVLQRICRNEKCPRYAERSDGTPELTTFDYGHLSASGDALVVSKVIAPILNQLLSKYGQTN
ncbi:acyltransferase family protein [Rhizobium sp. S152]|uniref:acyltransferase family protein n=1 Tax=Rhizobium sp. S152 TaxID=3055038 RepID=UPI0025A976E2|nr:acyltransferase family protein [Rhizobium sp. S152]MDM9625964.1 acyltransferase family protein [Rhizobium sp. S152]